MTVTVTKRQVLKSIGPGLAYREEFDNLPGGDDTSFTPGQMAAYGVDHRRIVRVFLRPEVLGRTFEETGCQIADEVLPVFEKVYPADTRPRAAIEAARQYGADPTPANKSAAELAAAEAEDAADAARAASVAMFADAEAANDNEARLGWMATEAARGAAEAAAAALRAAMKVRGSVQAAARDAARAAAWAGHADCPTAKIISIIEGACQ